MHSERRESSLRNCDTHGTYEDKKRKLWKLNVILAILQPEMESYPLMENYFQSVLKDSSPAKIQRF